MKVSNFRQFIVKYGFGQYWYKYPWQGEKRQFNNCHRGSFWYYNGFLLIGLLWLITGRPDWLILWPTVIWFFIVLYFGFPVEGLGYFQKFPVKWHELDEEQKWYYGNGVTSGDLKKQIPFPQYDEWKKIQSKMRAKYKLHD